MNIKKISLWVIWAVAALFFTSCSSKDNDYKSFVGTWSVEKIEYYNIDYAGNPIASSMIVYDFDPNDVNNSIRLIFKEDKTGELRDSAVDTIWTDWNPETQVYDSYVVNTDTIMVTKFTYSYDKSSSILYMNMAYAHTYSMKIEGFTNNSFIYENEYTQNYVEKAYLRRLSNTASKSASRNKVKHPRMPGSFLGDR